MTTGQGGGASPSDRAPWSRKFPVDRFGPQEQMIRIEATPEERAAIANAYDCLSVAAMAAEFAVRRRGERVHVEGKLRAEVTQRCVVTLEPVAAKIVETIDLAFAPSAPAPRRETDGTAEEMLSLDAEDPPEPIEHGQIDLGGAALEFFALALDPYPRKPGAVFKGVEAGPGPEHPFAALAKLKRQEP